MACGAPGNKRAGAYDGEDPFGAGRRRVVFGISQRALWCARGTRPVMLARVLVLGLVLLAGGCVTPQNPAVGGEAETTAQARAQLPRGMATQQAARPLSSTSAPNMNAVTPAGLTALPNLSNPQLSVPTPARPRPAIVRAKSPLQCVPYARELSKIALRGNAWTWWKKAEGRYERGSVPQPGAVLVLSKTRRLRYGHLAVVAEVRNSREIIVHQANWLNRGRIHRYTPVRDISENNDWSLVRVWYTPGRQMGSGHYPAYGFIYPKAEDSPDLRQAAR